MPLGVCVEAHVDAVCDSWSHTCVLFVGALHLLYLSADAASCHIRISSEPGVELTTGRMVNSCALFFVCLGVFSFGALVNRQRPCSDAMRAAGIVPTQWVCC